MSKQDEFISQVIEIYKSYPCLWKVKSKDYRNRNAKSQAYDVLVKKFQTIEPNANRDAVVKKINALRTSYRKELRKVIRSENSGVGEQNVYVPRLWYFNSLNFIREQEMQKKAKYGTLRPKNNGKNKAREEEEDPLRLSTDSPIVSYPPILTKPTSPIAFQSTRNRVVKRRNDECSEDIQFVGKRLAQPPIGADKFTDIGKAWASKLRELHPHQAIHAEKLINDIFYEAQLGNLHRNCGLQIPEP